MSESMPYKPLADRMRPKNISEVVGQSHLIGPGKPLSAYFDGGCTASAIFYGPPGTGKTTVARLIADNTNRQFISLNATLAGTADMKKVFEQAENAENGVLLYLDEIQYFNKKQQQTMLSYVESGKVQLIGATTENPYFYVYKALLSRSMVFEFKPVETDEIAKTVVNTLCKLNAETGGTLAWNLQIPDQIARLCAGDVRKALTILEALIQSVMPDNRGCRHLTTDDLNNLGQSGSLRFDRGGDEMYDLASGLHKSMRGSEPDAALHYLGRFLEAGDLITPIRRILCAASEDVGLAWNECALIAKALCDSALQLGLPEACLPLGQAVCMICNAPKSNSAHDAVHAAWDDVKRGAVYSLPRNLQNVHADTTGTAPSCAKQAQNYLYPHDYPNHYVKQPYLPEEIKDKIYYHAGNNPAEQRAKTYWDQIKQKEAT